MEYIGYLINLGVTLLIALLVWRYYHRRTAVPAEKYSTFGPRFWTGSIDVCVLMPITLLTAGLMALDVPRALAAFLIILQSLAWLIYTVYMHGRYGQTVGKMVTKVRVVGSRTEEAISWRQACIREGIPMILSMGCLVYEIYAVLTGRLKPSDVEAGNEMTANGPYLLLVSLPLLWFLAEVLTMLTNQKRRALHDLIAGTVVIRTNTKTIELGQDSDPAP